MAARLNPRHQAQVREKIKVSQLLNVVNAGALGVEMRAGNTRKAVTPLMLDAAKYLINQAIGMPPQMNDVNFSGQMQINEISDKPLTTDEWLAQATTVATVEDGAS